MLRIRRSSYHGLGAVTPDDKIFNEVSDDCGVVSGGGWFSSGSGRSCEKWSYNDLVTRNAIQKVKAPSIGYNKEIVFYPAPQMVEEDACQALRRLYEKGSLELPWKDGVASVEPGTFHPGKSWEEIVSDSERLRRGEGDMGNDWRCYGTDWELSQYPIPQGDWRDVVQSRLSICMRGSTNSVWCDKQIGSGDTVIGCFSFDIPSQYIRNEIALATASRWIADYSVGDPAARRIICSRLANEVQAVDPQWGHSYQARTYEMRVFENGQRSDSMRAVDGPIAKIAYAVPKGLEEAPWWVIAAAPFAALLAPAVVAHPVIAGAATVVAADAVLDQGVRIREHEFSPSKIRELISTGSWPPRWGNYPVVGASWLDDGSAFDVNTFLPLAAGAVAASANWGKILGIGGIALGGFLLVMTIAKK